MVSTQLKNISQNGNLLQVGVKIPKHDSNHHLQHDQLFSLFLDIWWSSNSAIHSSFQGSCQCSESCNRHRHPQTPSIGTPWCHMSWCHLRFVTCKFHFDAPTLDLNQKYNVNHVNQLFQLVAVGLDWPPLSGMHIWLDIPYHYSIEKRFHCRVVWNPPKQSLGTI